MRTPTTAALILSPVVLPSAAHAAQQPILAAFTQQPTPTAAPTATQAPTPTAAPAAVPTATPAPAAAPAPAQPATPAPEAAAAAAPVEELRSLFAPTPRQVHMGGRFSNVDGDPARWQRYQDLRDGLL